MENSFKSLIEQSKSVLIILPTKPYFDQVAAGLSLFLTLRGEKNVQITSASPMTVEFNRLIGVNKISQEVGNKNLVIRFVDYKATDIERVSYDIEDGQFKLTVIPKDQLLPPTQDQVALSFSGVAADLVILVGGANDSHFPMLSDKEFAGAKLIHIGTKDITLQGKEVLSFSRPAPSTSEVAVALLRENGYSLDEDAATNFVMGFEDATEDLTDKNLGPETFELFAWLLRSGGRRGARVGVSAANFPQGAIPTKIQPQQTQNQAVQQKATQSADMNTSPKQTTSQQSDQSEFIEDDETSEDTPKEWLQPKIFKGTSTK